MGNEMFIECCHEEMPKKEKNQSRRKNMNNGPLKEINLDSSYSTIHSLSRVPIQTKNIIRKFNGSPFEENEVIDLLGKGAYGKVYKIKHKSNGQIRAMKVISIKQLKENYKEEEIQNEIEILKNVIHPNIIKLYEVFNDNDNYYLLNEFCSEGELCKYLIHFKKLPEVIVKHIMYEIFTAINYLHINNIIHGDIKLENVMIDSVSSDSYQSSLEKAITSIEKGADDTIEQTNFLKNNFAIKLIDFGCSKIFTTNEKKIIKGKEGGTLVYSSPELLNNIYSSKGDIWSCGVLMYILLSGEIPFQGATESEIHDKIIKGRFCFYNRYFKDISFEAKDLIKKCFLYNPKERISAKEALNHPFFSVHIPKVVDSSNNSIVSSKTKEVIESLVTFSQKSKFFQAVLAYLTHNFAKKKETTELKRIFLLIDTDKDGKISKNELKTCLGSLGMDVSDDELNLILKRVDFDNDGYINYQEFLQATISTKDLFTDENLQSAFRLFDTHSDGTISVKELEEILGLTESIDKGIIKELLKDIGKTEEDEFTFSEFKIFIMHYVDQKGDEKISLNNSSDNTRITGSDNDY